MSSFAVVHDIEGYLPANALTNDQLQADHPDWNMETVLRKVGIRSRRLCSPNDTALDLAERAARQLLDRDANSGKEVDFLILCTQSPDHFLPSGACILQHRLGLPSRVAAFDFALGCSGYVYGLALAKSLVSASMAESILLLTTDTYTRYVNASDRACRVVFGDGASATLIRAEHSNRKGLGKFVFGTDGAGAENLIVPAGGLRLPKSEATAIEIAYGDGSRRSKDNIHMDAREVFAFAIVRVPEVLGQLAKVSGFETDGIDWFVFHQANKFMLDALRDRCAIPESKMVRFYEDVGNTVSSSIPLALCHYMRDGRMVAGQRLVLVGFGVGYSWAACDLWL